MKYHCRDHHIKKHYHGHNENKAYHITEQGDHSYAVSYQFALDHSEEEAERKLQAFCESIARQTEAAEGIVGHIKMICRSEKEKKLSYTNKEIQTELIRERATEVTGVAILLLPQKDVLDQIMDNAVSMLL